MAQPSEGRSLACVLPRRRAIRTKGGHRCAARVTRVPSFCILLVELVRKAVRVIKRSGTGTSHTLSLSPLYPTISPLWLPLADNCFYLRYVYARFAFLLQSKKICVTICSRANKRRTKKHVAHRASPRHCHACARCSAPCTRAHACRARSSHTRHACAPRQPCTCSHVATHACTRQKLDVMLEALATG